MIQKWKQWWHQEWYKHKCKMHSPWLITWGEKNISLPSKLTGSNQWRWLNAYLMKPDKAARLAELLVKAPNMYIIRYGSWCSLQASNVPHAIKPMIHDDPCIAEHPAITMANDWLIHPFFLTMAHLQIGINRWHLVGLANALSLGAAEKSHPAREISRNFDCPPGIPELHGGFSGRFWCFGWLNSSKRNCDGDLNPKISHRKN